MCGMPHVFIIQTGPDRYKIGRSNTMKESTCPLIWSLETEYDSTSLLLLRKKLEQHSCSDAPDCYEIPSTLLPKYIEEIEQLLATYIEAEEQSNVFAQADSNGAMLLASEEAQELSRELDIVKQRIALLECEKTFLENRIKALIGSSSGIQGVATWKTSVVMRLDTETVKTTYPEIYQTCLKETKSRRFCLQKGNN